jgi:transposase
MRPHGSASDLERRRRRAVALKEQGLDVGHIAARLGTTPRSVNRWLRAVGQRGAAGLAARPTPGRTPKLSKRRRQALSNGLLKGARAWGFATDLWTCPRIARLIQDRWGVTYHVDYIPRLMRSLGFSPSEAAWPGPGA